MATHLRVLLHDTRTSHSLLAQLGIKASLQFHDLVGPPNPGTVVFVGLGVDVSHGTWRYLAKLERAKHRASFGDWWEAFVLIQNVENVRFRRKDAVLAMANVEGGAHVDPDLQAEYHELTRNNGMAWIVHPDQRAHPGNPVPPIVRQVAHEVLETLREQVPESTAG
jgi:hypothetical protein